MKAPSSTPCNEMVVPVIGPMYNEGTMLRAGVYSQGRQIPQPEGPLVFNGVGELCDILAGTERFNLNFLLHSRGGDLRDFEMYRSVVGIAKSRGGVVRTYAPHMAGSAAAFLMTLADQRLVQNSTRVVFHIRAEQHTSIEQARLLTPFGVLPVLLESVRHVPLESCRAEDRETMRAFLIDGVRGEVRKHAEAALNRIFADPKNARDEVTLTGLELALLGKAEAVPRFRDLKLRFMLDTGINLHADPSLRRAWDQLLNPAFLERSY